MKNIYIFSSHAPSLINFRGPMLKMLVKKGNFVKTFAPPCKNIKILEKKLKSIGVSFEAYPISRSHLDFVKDLITLKNIYCILKNNNIDILMAYTHKPVVFCGFLAKYFSKISFYPMITGLGYGFVKDNKFKIKRLIFNKILINLLKLSLKYAKNIIFQNKDDKFLFKKLNILKKNQISQVINGSGVDLKLYQKTKIPKKLIFLMVSRLLIDKGVREYVEAARIVKLKYPNIIFKLVGELDSNPSSISIGELNDWIKNDYIKYSKYSNNINKELDKCRFFVLPSYREGMPRSVLEALAKGRPVITTNVAGCRETVIDGYNGYLVPMQNSKSLAKAMIKLLTCDNSKIDTLANRSYKLAKKKFDVRKINKDIIKILKL